MKTNLGQGVELQTNVTDQKQIKMRMNANVAMDIVTANLYTHPIQTLTQEYLCNARDAHRDAKKSNYPIEVVLPTLVDSVLRIRDFGHGISEEDMENVFCVLGESTKNKSNEATGGFGIGAKSGFAYGPSFLVKSIHKGVSRTYLAHRGSGSGGTLDLLLEEKTEEPSGVEIQISVKEKDIAAFQKAVFRATQFWDVKPNLKGIFDHELPLKWKEKKTLLTGSNWNLYHKDEFDTNIIENDSYNIVLLVDSIPYKLNSTVEGFGLDKLRPNPVLRRGNGSPVFLNAHVVLTISLGNGEVEINPNRETLKYSDETIKRINELAQDAFEGIELAIKDEKEKVTNVRDLLSLQIQLRNTFFFTQGLSKKIGRNNYSFDLSRDLHVEIIGEDLIRNATYQKHYISTRRRKNVICEPVKKLSFSENNLFIFNDEPGLHEKKIKEKIKQELQKRDSMGRFAVRNVYVVDQEVGVSQSFKDAYEEFLKEVSFVHLSSIKLPEKEKVATKRRSSKGKIIFHTLNVGLHKVLETTDYIDLDDVIDGEYLYILNDEGRYVLPLIKEKGIEFKSYDFLELLKFFQRRGVKLGWITKTQVKKIENINNFKSFDAVMTGKDLALLPKEVDFLKFESWSALPYWMTIPGDEFLDKSINKLQEFQKTYAEAKPDSSFKFSIMMREVLAEQVKSVQKETKSMIELKKEVVMKYPLVPMSPPKDSETLKDLVIYMNAKYKELKKKKGLS